jgi:Serine hydrolase (FSH1)
VTPIKPKFVIMAAGFRSGSLVHKNCYESRISFPSLHVSGTTDEIIPHEMGLLLESGFEYPKSIHHAGGHYFPATANEKQTYVAFFQDQLQRHLEEKELKNNGVALEDDDNEES